MPTSIPTKSFRDHQGAQFDVQEELDVDDSNASDDHFMSVYADRRDSVRRS